MQWADTENALKSFWGCIVCHCTTMKASGLKADYLPLRWGVVWNTHNLRFCGVWHHIKKIWTGLCYKGNIWVYGDKTGLSQGTFQNQKFIVQMRSESQAFYCIPVQTVGEHFVVWPPPIQNTSTSDRCSFVSSEPLWGCAITTMHCGALRGVHLTRFQYTQWATQKETHTHTQLRASAKRHPPAFYSTETCCHGTAL